MYVSFFGLKQPPFSIAPDPRYLYMSDSHREALAHLLYGVRGGGGFVLLSGEIGAGKTTVCRCFLEQVPPGCQVAYIFNPQLTVVELLQTVCDEFHIAVGQGAAPATVKTYVDALNAHLLAAHAQGRQCLLIIDEAQHLSVEVLEQLRLLTNLETSERKLLQIVLIGQPELRTLLAGPGLEQLAQRVVARYHLGALSAPETAAYVAHRLAVAGLAGEMPFDAAALRRIHALSGGVPRRINLLCDRALLGAFAEGRARVGERIVERAAGEVFDSGVPGRQRRPRLLTAAVVALGLAAAMGVGALLPGAWPGRGVAGEPTGANAPRAAAPVAPAASAVPPAAVAPAGSAPGAVADAGAAAAALQGAASAAAAPSQPAASAVSASASASSAGAGTGTGTGAGAGAASAASAAPGPAPAAFAQAAAGVVPPGPPPPLLPEPGIAAFPRNDAPAWRDLAALWGWQPAAAQAADPCLAAAARQLRCYRSQRGTLAQLRQLDRPALLLLRGEDGAAHHARLVALGERRAVLAAGAQRYSLPLEGLARWWRGEFATFWRAPEGYERMLEPGAQGPVVDALARGLAAWHQDPAPPAGQVLAGDLAGRLAGFQLAQGLKTDGIAGPTTFMQLNRVQGVAEPHLDADPPER